MCESDRTFFVSRDKLPVVNPLLLVPAVECPVDEAAPGAVVNVAAAVAEAAVAVDLGREGGCDLEKKKGLWISSATIT